MTVSIEDAPVVPFHRKLGIYASGGAFIGGYALGLTAIMLVQMVPQFEMSAFEIGAVGIAASVGAIPGSFIGGWAADKFGRRPAYTFVLFVIVASSFAGFFADSVWWIVAARFIVGVAVNADTPVATALIAEFMPARARGRWLGHFTSAGFLGAVVAGGVGFVLLGTGPDAWRWMWATTVIPTLVVAILRIGTPESPRWLQTQGEFDRAARVVESVWGASYDLGETPTKEKHHVPLRNLVRGRTGKRLLFTISFLTIASLPSSAIVLYGPQILQAIGFDGSLAVLGSAALSLIFLLGILLATPLVARVRRRPVLLISVVGSSLLLILLALFPAADDTVVMLIFLGFAAFSAGSNILVTIYPAESFPTELRGAAIGLGVAVTATIVSAVNLLTPSMIAAWSVPVFLGALGAFTGSAGVILYFVAPETNPVRRQSPVPSEQEISEAAV